jgi:hypothetical protein
VVHVTVSAETLAAVAAERQRRAEETANPVDAAERARLIAEHRLRHAVDHALHGDHTHGDAIVDGFDSPLGAEILELLACDCVLQKIVLDHGGVPIDMGRKRRLATRDQRRALVVRDGGCAFPGCDRPPSWCDAHHIIPWIPNGLTDLDNLVLLCRWHHTYLHRKHDPWTCRTNPQTRRPEFLAPDGTHIPKRGITSRPPDPGRPPDGRPPDEHTLAPAA